VTSKSKLPNFRFKIEEGCSTKISRADIEPGLRPVNGNNEIVAVAVSEVLIKFRRDKEYFSDAFNSPVIKVV
jgi:hypothetical protein